MNLEEKFNDYLTYQEVIKQALVPGHKSDWPEKEVEQEPVVEEPSITLIEFSIGETTYQAESGMTWAQWISSDYYDDSLSIEQINENYPGWLTGADDDRVFINDTVDEHHVLLSEEIISGRLYKRYIEPMSGDSHYLD